VRKPNALEVGWVRRAVHAVTHPLDTRAPRMFRVSLRYGIPLLIVVFTAVLAAYTIQKEWGAAEAVVRGEGVSQMISRMALLQKQFSYAFATGNQERIAQEMSLLNRASEPQIAILADDTDIVLGATKGEWVGRSLAEAAQAQWPRWTDEPLQGIIDRARGELSGELFLAAGGRYVFGNIPGQAGCPRRRGRTDADRRLDCAKRPLEPARSRPAHGRATQDGDGWGARRFGRGPRDPDSLLCHPTSQRVVERNAGICRGKAGGAY
jgi:hypothetical protein